ALVHNPDNNKVGNNKGFNFRRVIFADKTPTRASDQRRIKRAWYKEGEEYYNNVKR
ncbi:hypothetical protein P154DRAFT_427896, partial [Amniculicola lignicola CBS 123094]